MEKCKTCRWWENGECEFVHSQAASVPATRFEIVTKVADDWGLTERMMTGPDFGCIHHARIGMTLQEIKDAVESGKTVHWSNEGYVVTKDGIGRWHIVCLSNKSSVGLTWADDVTLNGRPDKFYVAE